MNLSTFISEHIESILNEWESFARTLRPEMTTIDLRDHAKQMLEALAKEIETPQSAQEACAKSQGRAQDETGSAASTHGTLRQESGFTVVQLVAEFRALRATVLRKWVPTITQMTHETTNEIVRFNEAIDQAVAESIARFTEETNITRDTFLAILGHDLRTPLAAVAMAGDYLTSPKANTQKMSEVGQRVKRSAKTMIHMVNDLLQFSRTQLGHGIPIIRRPTNVVDVCSAAVDEICEGHENCEIEVSSSGDLTGNFDAARLQQVITNLLSNAVQYRSKDHAVKISAAGESDQIVVQVRNRGPLIPKASLQAIFKPLVQLTGDGLQEGRPATSVGLGLFIAQEITKAHGGTISVASNSAGTTFTVSLPRI